VSDTTWAPFVYRDFYDVPRVLVARLEDGRQILFDCAFDEDREDFCDSYKIYVLPPDVDLSGSWAGLERHAQRILGEIPLRNLVFDETLRREISLSSTRLREILQEPHEAS
jgi:hypothetical protein